MIEILLAPNEIMSHSHETESTSMIMEGEATLEYAGQTIKMEHHVHYTIPPHTQHTMTNIGNSMVKGGCMGGH